MMVIRCEKCGQGYRIDETTIRGGTVRARCKACENVIVVTKPEAKVDAPADSGAVWKAAALSANQYTDQPSDPGAGPFPAADKPSDREPVAKEERQRAAAGYKEKRKRQGLGLTAKVTALMLAISLVPLVVSWVIQFRQMNERLRGDVESLMAATGTGMAAQVDEWVDKNLRVLEASAQLSDMISMDRKKQESILRAIQHAYPWMYLVFTTDTKGMNVARSDEEQLKDYSDRQYVKDVIAGKDISWQTLIGKTSHVPALILAVPIRSEGKVVGVLANAMTVQEISQKVATWRQGKTGFAFLVDEKGKVIAHPVKEAYLKQENLSQHPLIAAFMRGRNGSLAFTNVGESPYIGYVCGTKYRWALAVQQEEREAFNTLWRMRRFAYIVLAATVGIVLAVAWFLAGSLVRPIRKLTEAADRMSLGDLNVEIKATSRDEIGKLTEAVARMQDSLRLSIERLRRRK
jgi:methyl-accepting chemotaxis protein